MQQEQVDWCAKIADSKDNDRLVSVLFDLVLDEYSEHNISEEEYIRCRDLVYSIGYFDH